MFAYSFTASAAKDIKRLPREFQRQVFDAIEAMCKLDHPRMSRNVLKLEGYKVPTYRLRTGEYRVIFRAAGKTLLIGSVRNRQAGY